MVGIMNLPLRGFPVEFTLQAPRVLFQEPVSRARRQSAARTASGPRFHPLQYRHSLRPRVESSHTGIPARARQLAVCLCAAGLLATGSTRLPAAVQEEYRPPATQRLVMAYYHYDYQADPRKQLPATRLRDDSGRSLLTNHPWDSVGPWMSLDRSQWHKANFQLMAGGGIDVALAVYRGDPQSRRTWALRGLQMMTQGLRELRVEGSGPLTRPREHPLLGLALDLNGLAAAYGGPVDLRDPDVQRSLLGMIRDFYNQVPEEFRATVLLSTDREARRSPTDAPIPSIGRGSAYVVRLIGDSAVRAADADVLAAVSRRFAAEFGTPLLWIGTPALQRRCGGLDAVSPYPGATGPGDVNGEGWIRTATLGPGFDATVGSRDSRIRSRENGARLRDEFQKVLAGQPDWILIDSWNSFGDGSDIAPTFEHGLLYRDLLRGGILEFKQTTRSLDFAATILKAWAPRVLPNNAISQVEVLVQNAGTTDWNETNGASLSYRWLQNGKIIPTDWTVIPSRGQLHGETRSFVIGVAPPQIEGRMLPPGEYELEFSMVRTEGFGWKRFEEAGAAPFRLPIQVAAATNGGPYWISSTLPPGLRTGASYPVQLRVRNDSPAAWKKGATMVGYRWLRSASYLKGAGDDVEELVAEGPFRPLDEDVLPGRIVTLDVAVDVKDASGRPIPVRDPSQPWQYRLEWQIRPESGSSGVRRVPFRESVEVLARDPAPSFLGCSLSTELVGGRRETVTLGVRNDGPETWRKDRDKIAVHWYYFDGTVASWNDGYLPLPEDVAPFSQGQVDVALDRPLSPRRERDRKSSRSSPKVETKTLRQDVVLRDVPVRVPHYFGPMYVVFDLSFDGTNASTLPMSKGNDILVIPVNVYSPTLTPLPLGAHFNVDGISQDVERQDGNIDGRRNSFPGEYLPPYVARPAAAGLNPASNPLYPAGLWVRPLNDFDQPRTGFVFPSKAGGQPNMVAADGQRLLLPPLPRTAVHLMVACTEAGVSEDFVLYYLDGRTERKRLTFTHWNEPPAHGELIAFSTPHRHTLAGDDTESRCYLHHHIIQPDAEKELVALELPRRRAIKIAGITLESSGLKNR